MDPKLVKMAKDIPHRLKDVMNSMFEQSQPALRSGVSALRDSLKKLDGYLGDVEKEHLGSKPSQATAATGKAAKAAPRRRRGGERFMIGEFLVARLHENPKGMRPRDLAKLVSEAAPGQHRDPQAITNTTLARLKAQKQVVNRQGVWSASAKS